MNRHIRSFILPALLFAGCSQSDVGNTLVDPTIATSKGLGTTYGPHIMKTIKPGEHPVTGTGAASHLLYYGGRVVSNIQVVPVLWGPAVDPAITPGLQGAYQTMTNSVYWQWLVEYNTAGATPVDGGPNSNQIIGNGSAQAPVVITPSFMGTTIDDTNVKAELSAQIAAGHLPAPTADAAGNTNTYYPVFFPHGDTITLGGSASCQVFCAYHGTIAAAGATPEFYYAVQPDFGPGSGCDTGCGGDAHEFNNVTSVASHELTETTTDAEVGISTIIGRPLAWYDTAGGEIGDLCNGQQGTIPGTSVVVQKEFDNQTNACIVSKAPPGPMGTVAGTVTGGGAPVAGASIHFTGPQDILTATDAMGHYSIMLGVGTYTETVSAFGFVSKTIPGVVVTMGATTTENVTLTAMPAHALSGTVTDGADHPISGAKVTIVGTPIPAATTDAMGHYSFAAVPDGTYMVTASASPCLSTATQSVTINGAAATANFQLVQRKDAYGYSCTNPTYNYVDAGTVTTITGDDVIGPVAMPFPFTLYGQTYSTAYVSTNGFLSFLASATANPFNVAIPDPGLPNAAIYPFWDDLVVDGMSSIRTQLSGTAPSRTFTIEWRNATFFSNPALRVTFEVVLGEDGKILTQYKTAGTDPRGQGVAATIGIEDETGTVAFQYSFHQASVRDQTAVLYSLPPSGIVAGKVTDANDKLPIAGAQVQALQGATVVRSATTDQDGNYHVQVPIGAYTIQASASNYVTQTANVTVTLNTTTTQDFALATALAVVTPASLEFIMKTDETRTRVVTLKNAGTADLVWRLAESGGSPVAGAAAIPRTSHLIRNPHANPNASTTTDLYLNGKATGWIAPTAPRAFAPGHVIKSFPLSTLMTPFGAGFNSTVWISDAVGIFNQEYSTDGTPARKHTTPWAGVWPGDMAYDTTHNLMCQVNVGGDDGIYCWDPATGTVGGSITGAALPWTKISQRGLAYRASDDSFYIGGWNEGIVYHVKGLGAADKGAVISQCSPPDKNISGLAYNPVANILWQATNSATDTIYEINADTCTVLSMIPHPAPGNHGGGIELDAEGNLWTVSQSPAVAYLLESGVPLFNDVPWLSESPTSGTLHPGAQVNIGVVANTFGLPPAVYAASLFVLDNGGRSQQQRIPVSLVVTTYRQGVNAGGDDYTDKAGDLWSADQMLTGTAEWGYLQDKGTATTTKAIAKTPDPELFRSQRLSPYAYKFTNLPNGIYRVELGFAEFDASHALGDRLFDVIIKGAEVLPDLDITYEAGNLTADWHTFDIPVNDGLVDIRLVPTFTKDPPVINALRVTLRPDLH